MTSCHLPPAFHILPKNPQSCYEQTLILHSLSILYYASKNPHLAILFFFSLSVHQTDKSLRTSKVHTACLLSAYFISSLLSDVTYLLRQHTEDPHVTVIQRNSRKETEMCSTAKTAAGISHKTIGQGCTRNTKLSKLQMGQNCVESYSKSVQPNKKTID